MRWINAFEATDCVGCHLFKPLGIVQKLVAAGVTDIQHADRCTSCEPELYFSHRRDGGVTGRQAGIIVRDGP